MRFQETTQIRRRKTGINQGWAINTFKEFDLFPKFKNTDENEYKIESITTNFGGFCMCFLCLMLIGYLHGLNE